MYLRIDVGVYPQQNLCPGPQCGSARLDMLKVKLAICRESYACGQGGIEVDLALAVAM